MKLHILYIHGLNSSNLANKAQLLKKYLAHHHPDIGFCNPDLNMPPEQVVELLTDTINQLQQTAPVVLIGSSLGGFFATLMSNIIGCPAFLLNPSTEPHNSLQRFFTGDINSLHDDVIGTTTAKGWQVTIKDIKWLTEHQLTEVKYPDALRVLLKTGDELLPYAIAESFYRSQGVNQFAIQQGGDHRITDFDLQIPMIVEWVENFA